MFGTLVSALLATAASGDGSAPALSVGEFGKDQGWDSGFPRMLADVNGDGKVEILSYSGSGLKDGLKIPYANFPEFTSNSHAAYPGLSGVAAQNLWIAGYFSKQGTRDILHLSLPIAMACNVNPATSGSRKGAPIFPAREDTDPQPGLNIDLNYPVLVGDVNGDGHADIISRLGPAAEALLFDPNVVNTTGDPYYFTWFPGWVQQGFADRQNCDHANCPTMLGDVNADGKDDVLYFGNKGVWVSISN